MIRRIQVFLLACALGLAFTATASANLLDVIVTDYADDGRLDACKYSQGQLQKLKDLIPNDLAQYDAGFGPAVDDALARRAEGACNKGDSKSEGTAATPPATGGGTPPPASSGAAGGTSSRAAVPGATAAAQAPPTPGAQPTAAPEVAATNAIAIAAQTNDPATDAPFPILALAILAGLMALSGLLIGFVRWSAWEPAWLDGFRHAAGEAGWRASSTWAEFSDFVRFGR